MAVLSLKNRKASSKKLVKEPAPRKSKLGLERPAVTKRLTLAAAQYLSVKGYACHPEVALKAWGARRADLLGLNLKGHVILCEVKSCAQDFQTDKKWRKYLPYCNKMYFVVPYFLLNQKIGTSFIKQLTKEGVGIMVLNEKGWIDVVKKARNRPVDPTFTAQMILRLAWRGGVYSKRTLPRQLLSFSV